MPPPKGRPGSGIKRTKQKQRPLMQFDPRFDLSVYTPPPRPPGPPPVSPVQQQYNAELEYIKQLEAMFRQEQERRAQAARAQYAAMARALAPIAGQVEGIVNRQTQATTGFAQGFSDATRQLADQSAGDASALVSGFGMPGGVTPQGQAQGDALYGEFGYVPAVGLANYGAAQAAAAAMLPGFARMQGEQQIARSMQDFDAQYLQPLAMERLKLAAGRPAREAEAKKERQAEALKLYEAGLITQRDLAKRMGVPGWRRFPNALQWEESEYDLREVNGGLYAIDLKKGKIKTLIPGEGPKPDIRTSGGYIWERDPATGQWNPVGGTGPAPDKPSNYQTKTIGGKTYIFDPNQGVFYDPASGRPTVPKGTTGAKRTFTASQTQEFRGQSHSLAQDAYEGIPAEQTEDGVERPPMTYGQALQEALRAGIPLHIFIPILNRYYRPGENGRPIKTSRLRGYQEPGRSGKGKPAASGRVNTSFSGSESLVEGARSLMGYALDQGFTNLGTHNPDSRLPGGGISDHAKYPAEAFDIGGFSGGYGNAKARRMFNWLIKQPGVKYVILGNKIWSRERGLHAYTSGGHDTHIHVSVYPGASL